jgi:Tol biopolymer transport system component
MSRRDSPTGDWSAPTHVSALESNTRDSDPYVRPDGKMLVFTSNRAPNGATGDANLYAAYIDETRTVSAPRALTELNTSADEDNPVLSADGLAIYFARRGSASQDIFVARRKSVEEKFGAPTRIDELATATDERPTWISADECVLYLTIAKAAGVGDANDVYFAERAR